MTFKYFNTLLLFLSFVHLGNAQDYKKFKVGLGLGRNLTRVNSGLLYVEPSYLITPALSIGCRFEFIKTYVNIVSTSRTQGTLSASDVFTYSLNGQYYFGVNKKWRPYVGFGAGVWAMYIDNGTFVKNGNTTSISSGDFLYYACRPGVYPSIGFDWWHLNVALEYNIVPSTHVDVVDSSSSKSIEIKNSYLFLKAGIFLGGSKRKPHLDLPKP